MERIALKESPEIASTSTSHDNSGSPGTGEAIPGGKRSGFSPEELEKLTDDELDQLWSAYSKIQLLPGRAFQDELRKRAFRRSDASRHRLIGWQCRIHPSSRKPPNFKFPPRVRRMPNTKRPGRCVQNRCHMMAISPKWKGFGRKTRREAPDYLHKMRTTCDRVHQEENLLASFLAPGFGGLGIVALFHRSASHEEKYGFEFTALRSSSEAP